MFSRVGVDVLGGETGVIVVFEVEEHPLIRRIEYTGAPFRRSLTEEDVTEWFLATNVGLVVDSPLSYSTLSRARKALLLLLQSEGEHLAEVDTQVEALTPSAVKVLFRVQEGP